MPGSPGAGLPGGGAFGPPVDPLTGQLPGAKTSAPPSGASPSISKYVYPFSGSFPISETFAQGDPGTDWSMPTGTPIKAIADGIVTIIGESGYGPAYVQLDHGGGIQSFYGHNSQALVAVGQHVKQGQTIALSGNAGNSTGPHLELGIIVNGKHVDPVAFLKSQGASAPPGDGSVQATQAGLFGLDINGIVNSIFKPLIEFAIEAGMVVGGALCVLYGLVLIARQTKTGSTLTKGILS